MVRILCALGGLVLSAATVPAQQPAAPPEGLPSPRGVYYRAGTGWEALPRTVFLPLESGQVRSLLSLGPRGAAAQLPGPQSVVRSGSARPVFYIRGFSPASGLYLVHARSKREYRDVRMSVDRHAFDGPHFRNQDLRAFDIDPVAPDVVSLRPRANLAPGEYVIVPPVEPAFRWIQFGYSFGVPAGAAAP